MVMIDIRKTDFLRTLKEMLNYMGNDIFGILPLFFFLYKNGIFFLNVYFW